MRSNLSSRQVQRRRTRTTFSTVVLVIGVGIFAWNEWDVAHQVSVSTTLRSSFNDQTYYSKDHYDSAPKALPLSTALNNNNTRTRKDEHYMSTSSTRSGSRDRRLLSYWHEHENTNPAQVWGYRTEMRSNAILYLAQRQVHSTYSERHPFPLLLKSLRLLYEAYLRQYHHDVDVYILHTGDFSALDYPTLQAAIGGLDIIKLLNLNNTKYWKLPDILMGDDSSKWRYMSTRRGQIPFSIGYRHMCRLMSLGIWDLFRSYHYLWRLDEDSFIFSSIDYNIFDFMEQHDYVYGYRLVTYELWEIYDEWNTFLSAMSTKKKKTSSDFMTNTSLTMMMMMMMQRPMTRDKTQMAMYNNFFVAKVSFFRSEPVQEWLSYVDEAQLIYRKRLGDLLVHSATIYAYAPPTKVHRFLDFSYQHMTILKGCPVWGAYQTGYKDTTAGTNLIHNLTQEYANCTSYRINALTPNDLSPTYHHLWTNHSNDTNYDTTNVTLLGFVAGSVEASEGRGIKSG